MAALTTDQVAKLTTAHLVALSSDQVAALGTQQVSLLTTTQVAALGSVQVAGLSLAGSDARNYTLTGQTSAQAKILQRAVTIAGSVAQEMVTTLMYKRRPK